MKLWRKEGRKPTVSHAREAWGSLLTQSGIGGEWDTSLLAAVQSLGAHTPGKHLRSGTNRAPGHRDCSRRTRRRRRGGEGGELFSQTCIWGILLCSCLDHPRWREQLGCWKAALQTGGCEGEPSWTEPGLDPKGARQEGMAPLGC